jgi:hypothetical protein
MKYLIVKEIRLTVHYSGNNTIAQLEITEKEVQDTSCRGSGGVPPD